MGHPLLVSLVASATGHDNPRAKAPSLWLCPQRPLGLVMGLIQDPGRVSFLLRLYTGPIARVLVRPRPSLASTRRPRTARILPMTFRPASDYDKPVGKASAVFKRARSRSTGSSKRENPAMSGVFLEADEGTRTPDLLITSELLYQLSYVGPSTPGREARPAERRCSVVAGPGVDKKQRGGPGGPRLLPPRHAGLLGAIRGVRPGRSPGAEAVSLPDGHHEQGGQHQAQVAVGQGDEEADRAGGRLLGAAGYDGVPVQDLQAMGRVRHGSREVLPR